MAPKSTTSDINNEKPKDPKEDGKQRSILAGRNLANPPPGEEIVITGMAGKFPDSHNIDHFKDNLYNKVDLISSDERRWIHEHPEIPKRGGKLFNVNKFDAGFFGIHHFQVRSMDPMCRLLLERAFEAIIDAGFHPKELEGTKTGVYVGSCVSETENIALYVNCEPNDGAIIGCTRSMLANRISYYLKLNGPSFVNDTACSSSLYSFEQAYRDMREDKCDYALVCGSNLCLHPYVSLQFARLGVLSYDGRCKSFDNNANGYARSEGIVAILLQKASTARRIYARVLHAKTNCDGFKEQGITYPSGEVQKVLLEDFYQECQIPVSSLSYMEAHGTGTKVGDPEELQAIDEVFCTGRDRPLLIGSVKSNIGHNEPVSGLCSIVKVVIGMENGYLCPNINFSTIREGVEGLEKKRMIVVDEKIPWPDNQGLAGINSFGFGGANSHILLKWNEKLKKDGGLPKDDLPRLVCISGRVPGSVYSILDNVKDHNLDAEYIGLLHHIFKKMIPGHQYRGYSIMSKNGELCRSEKYYDEIPKPMVYLFGASDKKWASIGHQLFSIPQFAGTIQRIHEVYYKNGLPVNVTEIISSYKADNLPHYIIGTVSVQLGLYEVLKEIGVKPQKSFGYSIGAIANAYAEGQIQFDEAALTAFYTSLALTEVMEKDEFNKSNIHNSKTAQHLLKYVKKVIGDSKGSPGRSAGHKTVPEQLVEKILTHSREDAEKEIPKDVLVCEIGTSGILKKGVDDVHKKSENSRVNLVEIGEKDAVVSFLEGLGGLFENGVDLSLHDLYPKVEFPVSRNTPMISHLIKWNHEYDWYIMNYKEWVDQFFGYRLLGLTTKDEEWSYLTGHVVDGRNLFPATGYLCVVWNLFASMWKKMIQEYKVVFENVKFIRAVNIPKSGTLSLMIAIQKCSGAFEVVEGDVAVVTGYIRHYKDDQELGDYAQTSLTVNEEAELPLNEKDVYKELRLRGYNYSGLFRGIKKCDKGATQGEIEWKNNFTAFMDNMLQMKILQEDTRNLYVPTSINRIVIDPREHLKFIEDLNQENPVVPVFVDKTTGIIRTKFIEIRGLWASPIPRRKQMGEPVLETYKFIPNITELSLEESVRVNVQIALENLMSVKVKVVEIPIQDAPEDYAYLAPILLSVLGDLPLMQPEITILTDKTLEISNVTVENKPLKDETNCLLIVSSNVTGQSPESLEETMKSLRDNGVILSREALDAELNYPPSLEILTVHITPSEKLVMLRKKLTSKNRVTVGVPRDNTEFSWLPVLQNLASKTENEDIVLYAQNDPKSGILGLVNCLRREPKGDKFKAVFIQDEESLQFDLSDEIIAKQLAKGLAVNVYKNGTWGTYRHMLLPENPLKEAEHSFAIVSTPGDLSTLKWIQGPLKRDTKLEPGEKIIDIHYASINFRDVMTSSGKISVDVITRDRTKQMCVQGFEYAGKTLNGDRIYGMVTSGCLANIVAADNYMAWPMPEEWTMAEAATVPCVYSTVIMALLECANIKAGETILIHAGTGGVGQAAINIATHYGLTVFTTVGTSEKREFIKKNFPHIRDTHIGNSRDTTFEQMVMYQTKGRGVDVVLNSLAEEKLQASVRCLAKGGRFIEIGKFDLASDNPLSLQVFEKGCSFHSVMLDMSMTMDPFVKESIYKRVRDLQDAGALKPLPRTIFKEEELEQAFRFMAGGKHMGKVILKIKNEEEPSQFFKCQGRYYCDREKTIIIIGGLGGFGLELADWLVLRNARKLILTSRKGVTTGYQSMRIRTWRSYGVDVVVSTEDVTKKEDCIKLLSTANEMGPVQAIFNLGVVLKDAILENQNEEDFKTSFAPKAYATEYLDELTRTMCPELRDFVIFSSVSCGRGNAGQTNYGMANSIMERICEQRKKDGYPALAIEWGAVGDVGLVAEMQESNTELVIGGTLQQRITSCLNVMDTFLLQDAPIVSSMVVAEKRGGTGNFDNAIDAIANILGLRDIKLVSPHQTLPELGMDSIMAVEIKQILESEYEIVLTPQEIRSMTFARIQELEKEKESGETKKKDQHEVINAFTMFLRNISPTDEELVRKPYIVMPTSVQDDPEAPLVLMIPGIQGFATVLDPLMPNLKMRAVALQYNFEGGPQDIHEIAEKLFSVAKELIPGKQFNIIGYSYGALITLELINMLEQEGYTGKVVLIDGSPDVMKEICQRNLIYESDATFDTGVLCGVLSLYLPLQTIEPIKIKMLQCSTYEERVQAGVDYVPKDFPVPTDFLVSLTTSFYERIKSINNYKKTFEKLQTPCKLIRPKIPFVQDFEENYLIPEYCQNFDGVSFIDGDHVSILNSQTMGDEILEYFTKN